MRERMRRSKVAGAEEMGDPASIKGTGASVSVGKALQDPPGSGALGYPQDSRVPNQHDPMGWYGGVAQCGRKLDPDGRVSP